MAELPADFWAAAIGFGLIWIGALITANGGLPRQLKSGDQPAGEPGSERAFLLFWLDQYSYIGLTLLVAGAGLALWGLLT